MDRKIRPGMILPRRPTADGEQSQSDVERHIDPEHNRRNPSCSARYFQRKSRQCRIRDTRPDKREKARKKAARRENTGAPLILTDGVPERI